jgi:glycerophosphoryl diester phosphodiesterase
MQVMKTSKWAKAFAFPCAATLALSGCSIDQSASPDSAKVPPPIARRLALLENEKSNYVMVVAHRSCWQNAPENSVQAIEACVRDDIDIIEFDVRKTKDDKLVVMHDETLERTTSGSGLVADHTLVEIQALILKERDGSDGRFTPYHPPSLEQALQAANGKLLINLDLKESLFQDAFEIVKKMGMEKQILMKMNADANGEVLSKASFIGQTQFMPIMFECTPFYDVYCTKALSTSTPKYQRYAPVAYEIVFQNDAYLKEGVAMMRKQGARIWVNTLIKQHAAGKIDEAALHNPDAVWGRVVRLGANIIQTNNPSELTSYLKQKGLRGT